MALLPLRKDAFSGASNQHLLARACTILGERDGAVGQFEALLAVPYYLSPV